MLITAHCSLILDRVLGTTWLPLELESEVSPCKLGWGHFQASLGGWCPRTSFLTGPWSRVEVHFILDVLSLPLVSTDCFNFPLCGSARSPGGEASFSSELQVDPAHGWLSQSHPTEWHAPQGTGWLMVGLEMSLYSFVFCLIHFLERGGRAIIW